jgi:EAL domain-containing protein (putative c-di-GMP-specific phosphodiesterase class I)
MGKLVIYLQHVPGWQLVLWNEPEGELVRALVWAGPTEVSKVLRQLTEKVPERAIRQLQNHASLLPLWIQDALQGLG